MGVPWKKKLWLTMRLSLEGDGYKRAELLKKQNWFAYFGEKIYWFPRNIPADPSMIELHNNIKIATGVYFCTHDIMDLMLNDNPECIKRLHANGGQGTFIRHYGKITVFDNVFIGAHSTIIGSISIGPNVIIAANSVVVKDVPPNSIVGGNPAKIIGTYDALLDKRIRESLPGE